MRTSIYLYILILLGCIISSCEEDITLTLPEAEKKLVVEGKIEPGSPPFIMLTNNSSYFKETNISDFENIFVHGAIIKVSDGIHEVQLIEVCSDTISAS